MTATPTITPSPGSRPPAKKTAHPTRWITLGVAVVVAAFAVVLATQVSSDPTAETTKSNLVGKAAPGFSLTTFDGQPVSTSSLAGKSVVVNFWNSWCVPCQRELPELKQFYAAHANDPDFAFVGIVRDDTGAAARGYAIAEKMNWLLATDSGGDAALAFGTRGQPETFSITPDGVVAGALIGPASQRSLETLLAAARANGG